jgi:hypothetical protein
MLKGNIQFISLTDQTVWLDGTVETGLTPSFQQKIEISAGDQF